MQTAHPLRPVSPPVIRAVLRWAFEAGYVPRILYERARITIVSLGWPEPPSWVVVDPRQGPTVEEMLLEGDGLVSEDGIAEDDALTPGADEAPLSKLNFIDSRAGHPAIDLPHYPESFNPFGYPTRRASAAGHESAGQAGHPTGPPTDGSPLNHKVRLSHELSLKVVDERDS